MTLGQRIQELRKQSGLSQEALGEALGVSRQAVSKWEGDNGIPEPAAQDDLELWYIITDNYGREHPTRLS